MLSYQLDTKKRNMNLLSDFFRHIAAIFSAKFIFNSLQNKSDILWHESLDATIILYNLKNNIDQVTYLIIWTIYMYM